MITVFNSSPLIFLSKLNVIDQSLQLFSKVIVPSYVKKEILQKEDITSDKLNDLLKANNVIVIQAKNLRMFEALCRKLGKGESEAIVLAIEQSAHLVILDDHVARAEATRIGLNVKGTLGIIRRLLDLDVIQYDLDELYRDLMEMKFRIKRGIFNEVFKRSVL
jgi:predicted nucleic acid-binding protein